MKFQLINNEWIEIEPVNILNFDKRINEILNKPVPMFYIIDKNEIKNTWENKKNDWFGKGEGVFLHEGIFWSAFLIYLFPWMMDIAKVFFAFKVAQSFFQEHSGNNKDGKTGFQSIVYYGKWYLLFMLIPWAVELIDQVGEQMYNDLINKGIEELSKP